MHPTSPSKDGVSKPQSRLLQLPRELRNEILSYLVTQPEPLDLCTPGAPFTIETNIMYVCKQIRDESRSLLYHNNTLEVGIEGLGSVCSLHFSRHHSTCEYRAKEAISEISSVFLERFSHFQFRFANARQLGSLRRAVNDIKHQFHGKHITVIPPPPKERRIAPSALTVSLYPRITSTLLCFSLIRCASLSISSPVPGYDVTQHEKLVDLVTSDRPVVDMTREYESAQCSARTVGKMLVPDGFGQEYERLRERLFVCLAAMCDSANSADQDAFLVEKGAFEGWYREVEELQWAVL
jgi:hypothetical protein